MSEDGKKIALLIAAVCGIFFSLFCVVMFNAYVLSFLPLPARMMSVIVSQWFLLATPIILTIAGKEKNFGLDIKKERLPQQIFVGLCIAAAMSLVLTVLPILFGLKEFVGATNYTEAWQFAFEFIFMLVGVALAEELIFRGYIFKKLLEIKNSRWFAIVVSSALFGLFHIFSGSPLQIIITASIGFFYCVCREKIKNCTIVSLIVAHGVYNALITLWVGIL